MSKERKLATHIIESSKNRDIEIRKIEFLISSQSKLSSNQIKK